MEHNDSKIANHSDISTIAIVLNSTRTLFKLAAIRGNAIIILCVIWYENLKTPTNIAIANLAAADLVNGMNTVFVALLNFTFCTGYSSTLSTLWIVQQSLGFLGFLTNNVDIFYIALERFANIMLA